MFNNRIMEKPLRSQATKDRILEAARTLFAERGFERTTVRLVAARAVIHPSLVIRYFGSKEALFAAAVHFELRLPNLAEVKGKRRGEFLAGYFLQRWEGPDAGDELPALLRVAVTHPEGKTQLIRIFQEQLRPALTKILPRHKVASRAALIATQAIGLAFTRYVLELPAVVALSREEIVTAVGGTFQRYLEG
jgi:AcrR family transcriptional regulator